MANANNIITGEANLYLSPAITSWTNVGYTHGGVELAWEPNMIDIEVDQLGDAARIIQSKIKVMVKTSMAEVTLQNLTAVWGYSGSYGTTVPGATQPGLQSGGTTLNVGVHGATPEERQIKVVGPAAGSTAQAAIVRTFIATRAISAVASAGSWQRNDSYKLPVDFRVLPNSANTGAEYGTIIDV